MVNIVAVVEETCDPVAYLGGGDGRVLALAITVFPHDLRVADNVWPQRRSLQLVLVDLIAKEPGGLEICTNLFFNKTR